VLRSVQRGHAARFLAQTQIFSDCCVASTAASISGIYGASPCTGKNRAMEETLRRRPNTDCRELSELGRDISPDAWRTRGAGSSRGRRRGRTWHIVRADR